MKLALEEIQLALVMSQNFTTNMVRIPTFILTGLILSQMLFYYLASKNSTGKTLAVMLRFDFNIFLGFSIQTNMAREQETN